jgi:Domain of unknown function (DUF4145)
MTITATSDNQFLKSNYWDAASIMARSAIQLVLRHQKAKGANLKQEIDDLARQCG